MIDDLIFFGIDHNIPEEKGIGFLLKMFSAYGRNIKRWLEPLQNMVPALGGKQTFTPKPLPEHLRKRSLKS